MMQNLVISLLMSASAAVASGGSHGAFKARAPVPEARQQNVQKWDFTKIANPSVPAPIEDFAQSQGAGATHEYFGTAEWNDVWALQSWSKEASKDAPTRMTNSLNNIYIQQNTDAGAAADETFLTLRTVRHDGFQSAAEIESRRHDYQYVTMKMRARTVGDAGACTAMFTYYLPDGGKVQEADLEILTKEADNIAHYTNQPSYDGDQEFPEATGKSDCYSPLIGQERKEEEKRRKANRYARTQWKPLSRRLGTLGRSTPWSGLRDRRTGTWTGRRWPRSSSKPPSTRPPSSSTPGAMVARGRAAVS